MQLFGFLISASIISLFLRKYNVYIFNFILHVYDLFYFKFNTYGIVLIHLALQKRSTNSRDVSALREQPCRSERNLAACASQLTRRERGRARDPGGGELCLR